MAESMTYKGRLAINPFGGGTTTFNSSSIQIPYLSHTIKETINRLEDDSMRGTRTRTVERLAQGNKVVGGQLKLQPTNDELQALMPFIMGVASSGGTYALADALTDLYVLIENVATVDTYLLRISKATFEARSGDRLNLTLDLAGKTLTKGSAGSFPGTVPAADLARSYMFYDNASGITLAGTAYPIEGVQVVIDNAIVPTFMMGQDATDLEATDRKVTVSAKTKYTADELTLIAAIRAGTAMTGSLSFTNGSDTFAMTFGNLFGNSQSVEQTSRAAKMRYPLELGAYGVGTTKELVVTLPA
jgi:hypothetical protein